MENGVLFYINAYFGVFRQQVGGTNQEAFGGGLDNGFLIAKNRDVRQGVAG